MSVTTMFTVCETACNPPSSSVLAGVLEEQLDWIESRIDEGQNTVVILGEEIYSASLKFFNEFFNSVVVTPPGSQLFKEYRDRLCVPSIDGAIMQAASRGDDIFIIGGPRTFDQAVDYCDRLLVAETNTQSQSSETVGMESLLLLDEIDIFEVSKKSSLVHSIVEYQI